MSLSSSLRRYADGLAPPEIMIQKAGGIIQRIQTTLHEELQNKYSIDRIRPLGSLTKKTSLWFKMDIDVVVYLNNEMPPYEDFKDQLEDVAIMHLDENCTKTRRGLKLKVNGFEIDLLPATNFMYATSYNGDLDQAKVQNANTLEYLRCNFDGKDKLEFSSSLSEAAVAFEQYHSAFSHAISRLAKYWGHTIGIPGFSFGRSTILECLGVWAAEEEERCHSQDMLRGFRRFLEMVARPDHLKIIWTTFYQQKDIPESIRRQRPLLVDPTNPYNNLLEGDLGKNLRKMSFFAQITLGRLNEAEIGGHFPLDRIFEPQPNWVEIFRGPYTKTPQNFLIGREASSQVIPKVETRSGAKGVDSKIAESYLFAFTDVVADSTKVDGGKDVAEIVKSKLEQFIQPLGQWSPSSERHEDRHMTFTIPIGKDSREVIKVSCNWL